ncbi:hypothetical protein D4764_15G0006510 [Takifugu flavidus]|uniref:Uncharacterized protein n=1 Tax=Takifugu flavidus TaxID=433684 RepID=A0A5C6P540_9TELE|nr:hypothetical protein D4764_15G0006510 [Takifugu flavidus]
MSEGAVWKPSTGVAEAGCAELCRDGLGCVSTDSSLWINCLLLEGNAARWVAVATTAQQEGRRKKKQRRERCHSPQSPTRPPPNQHQEVLV